MLPEPCLCVCDTTRDRKSHLGVGMCGTEGEGQWGLALGWISNALCTKPIYKNSNTFPINAAVHCHYRTPWAFSHSALRFGEWHCFSQNIAPILACWMQSTSCGCQSGEKKKHVWAATFVSLTFKKKTAGVAALGSVLTFILHLNFWLRSCRTPCHLCTT